MNNILIATDWFTFLSEGSIFSKARGLISHKTLNNYEINRWFLNITERSLGLGKTISFKSVSGYPLNFLVPQSLVLPEDPSVSSRNYIFNEKPQQHQW